MLSEVELDQPTAYVGEGAGTGVVGSAPLWPNKITVNSDWTRQESQTIEFWFKQAPDSTNSYCVLSVGSNNSNRALVAINRANHASYPGKVYFSFASPRGSGSFYSQNRYDDGNWHHCVIAIAQLYGVTNIFFYIDGQLDSQDYRNFSFNFGSWGNTTIGDCERFVRGYIIEGSPIDEIALYDYWLDSDRIEAHYNEVMASPPGPTLALSTTIDIVGKLKTNKLLRLRTAQFSVDGLLNVRVAKDPMPFSIASQIDILGNMTIAVLGKPVSTSIRLQSSEIDVILHNRIGIRL